MSDAAKDVKSEVEEEECVKKLTTMLEKNLNHQGIDFTAYGEEIRAKERAIAQTLSEIADSAHPSAGWLPVWPKKRAMETIDAKEGEEKAWNADFPEHIRSLMVLELVKAKYSTDRVKAIGSLNTVGLRVGFAIDLGEHMNSAIDTERDQFEVADDRETYFKRLALQIRLEQGHKYPY